MLDSRTSARIQMSRQVLTGWQRTPPVGKLEDLLRMISEEIEALGAIADRHPDETAIVDLIAGYRDLASQLRAKAH